MADKKVARTKGITCAIYGSQVIIRANDPSFPFCSHLNYVIDRDRCGNNRRAKSLQAKHCSNNGPLSRQIDAGGGKELLKDVIIEIKKQPQEECKQISPEGRRRSRSRWTTLRSVLRAVALFRTSEAETIKNEQDLDKALENYNHRNARANSLVHYRQQNFEEHFREERFYDLIAKGSPEDIHELEELLGKDRRTYLHNPGDLASPLNAPNSMGRTPLYVATQNGGLPMIKYLIGKGSNPLVNSKVSPSEEESNLLVAARWKHLKIVEFYLDYCKWPPEELKKAKAAAGNAAIKDAISKRMGSKSGWLCCVPRKKPKAK